jgi:hemolysin activation/secretion protein
LYRIASLPAVLAALCWSLAAVGQEAGPAKPQIRLVIVRGPLGIGADQAAAISMLKAGLRVTPGALEAGRLLVVDSLGTTPERESWLRQNLLVRSMPVPTQPGAVDVVFEVSDPKPARSDRDSMVPLPRIAAVSVSGNGPVPRSDVLAQIQTRPGDKADVPKLHADVDRIRRFYDSKGYIAAAVGRVELESGVLDVPIRVSRIQRMRFEGLKSVPESTVRKHLTLKVGDYYNARTLKKDHGALLRLGLFQAIEPDIVSPSPGDVELILRFVEKVKRMP